MDVTLDISADTLGPAFAAWADYQQEVRGKNIIQVAQRGMQYVVSFAMAEIEAQKPSDGAKIRSELLTLTTGRNRVTTGHRTKLRGRRSDSTYRNTIAAKIVFAINYRNARLKAAFGDDAGAYADVAKFVSARAYSARHHKVSGFLPALAELSTTRRGLRQQIPGKDGPRYRNAPGEIRRTITANAAEILVAAWPSAAARPGAPAPLGLARLVPDAFTKRLPDVQALFLKFAQEDGLLTAAAAKAGLRTLTF